MTTRSSPCVPR